MTKTIVYLGLGLQAIVVIAVITIVIRRLRKKNKAGYAVIFANDRSSRKKKQHNTMTEPTKTPPLPPRDDTTIEITESNDHPDHETRNDHQRENNPLTSTAHVTIHSPKLPPQKAELDY